MGLLMNEVRGDNYTECLKYWILCSIPLQKTKITTTTTTNNQKITLSSYEKRYGYSKIG